MCLCMCVSVFEKEEDRYRQTDRQTKQAVKGSQGVFKWVGKRKKERKRKRHEVKLLLFTK